MNHYGNDLEQINQSIKELLSLYRGAVSKAGVSENEFWVWYALLILQGEFTQQDICEIWSLPKQTANTIIGNMVKRGYIKLEMIPGTRNRKQIYVTVEGRRFGEQIVMPIYQAEQRALQKLPEEEKKIWMKVLIQYVSLFKGELNDAR